MAARRTHKRYSIYEWVFLTMGEKFENQFQAFAKFGDSKSDGTTISLSQSDKWMKQAKVIDSKGITTTDTGIAFKKFKSMRLTLQDYNKFIDDLASTKKLNADDLRKSLAECGAPGTHSAAGPKLSVRTLNMIARLTDPNHFTGIHKKYGDGEASGSRRGLEAGSSTSGRSYRAVSPIKSARRPIVSSRSPKSLEQPASRPPVSVSGMEQGVNGTRPGTRSARSVASSGRLGANNARLGANSARLGANSARLGANIARMGANNMRLGANSARMGTSNTRSGVNSARRDVETSSKKQRPSSPDRQPRSKKSSE